VPAVLFAFLAVVLAFVAVLFAFLPSPSAFSALLFRLVAPVATGLPHAEPVRARTSASVATTSA
jgi:hypothetical protein